MAKTSKKNSHETPQNGVLTPDDPNETPVSPIEDPTIADDRESEPPAQAQLPMDDEPLPPTVEAQPEKRRPGRPRKDDPPVLRSLIIDRINNLESWEATRVYVYRWEPYTDRKVGGRQSVCVKRFEGPFDEQDIMEDQGLGSGVYELVVNRTDPQTRTRRIIDSGMVKILNMRYPPRIPKGEWVDDERNKDWEWCRNICDKNEAPAPVTIATPADPLVEVLREQNRLQHEEMKAYRERLDKLNDQMREASNKKDPAEQTFLSVLAPFVPAIVAKLTAPPPDPMASLTTAITLLKQVNPPPPAEKPHDAAAELEKLLDLQAKMEERIGGRNTGGRSRKSGTQEFITDMTEAAAPILAPFAQAAAGIIVEANRRAAMQQNGQQQPQMQQQPQYPQQQPIGPGIEAPPPAAAPPGPQLVTKKPTLQDIADRVLFCLKKQETGLDLGDWYIDEYGQKEFEECRGQGKARILADLQSVPNTWRFISEYLENGALDRLLTEFIDWEPPEEQEDDEQEEPPPAANPQSAEAIKTGWSSQPEGVTAQ